MLMAEESRSRVLGIDYGAKRIGVAVSDPTGLIARGLPTISHESLPKTLELLENLVHELGVRLVVVGFPLTLRGEVGHMADKTERFMQKLRERLDVPVEAWDERLTTALAHRTAKEYGKSPGRNKTAIDEIAATLILQNFLDHQRSKMPKLDE